MPIQLVFGKSGFEDDVLALDIAEAAKTRSKTFKVWPSHAIGHEPNTPNLAALLRSHGRLSALVRLKDLEDLIDRPAREPVAEAD